MQGYGMQTGGCKSELNLSINWHLEFGGMGDSRRGTSFFFRVGVGHLKYLTKNVYAASRSQIKVRCRFVG